MKSVSRGEDVAKIVERQMRNWELARTQRHQDVPVDRPEVADFIAISRQVGAGGVAIASALGEKLGWPVWDKKILDVMAQDDDLRRRIYKSMDERDLNWLEEALRAAVQPEFVRNDYFHVLNKTILSLARQSCAVFLGRGADQMLPRDRGLRVRLVAPLDWRVREFAGQTGLASAEASAQVRRIDHERDEFIRKHFCVAADEPGRSDVTINLATIPHDLAVDLIMAARTGVAAGRRHA